MTRRTPTGADRGSGLRQILNTLRTLAGGGTIYDDALAALDHIEAEDKRLRDALAPMKHAVDLGDRDCMTEYMESRDWDALAAALKD